MSKSCNLHHTIAVIGAGASGLACALAAARAGSTVILLEKTARLGGTVTAALIHTLGGLYDDAGEFLNPGLPVELVERLLQASSDTSKRHMGRVWVLNVDPLVYEWVVEDWIASQSGITVLRQATVEAVTLTDNRITGLNVLQDQVVTSLAVDAVVDTTGTAEIVRMLDATKVQAGDAQAGLIFQIQGVFPKNVGLRRGIQNFANMRVLRRGELGIRDGGRIQGDYCLTLTDVKTAPLVHESAGRCAWPVEYWRPATGVTLEYLPVGHSYAIPLSALHVAGMANVWAAGKCLSAEKQAQASAKGVRIMDLFDNSLFSEY